jgi:hypothetical protein
LFQNDSQCVYILRKIGLAEVGTLMESNNNNLSKISEIAIREKIGAIFSQGNRWSWWIRRN